MAVGLALGIKEIRNPIHLPGMQRRTRRRMLGASLLSVLGMMIIYGPIPQPPVTKEILMQSAGYWVGILALTCALVVLAFFDTIDGVRTLNNHLSLGSNKLSLGSNKLSLGSNKDSQGK